MQRQIEPAMVASLVEPLLTPSPSLTLRLDNWRVTIPQAGRHRRWLHLCLTLVPFVSEGVKGESVGF